MSEKMLKSGERPKQSPAYKMSEAEIEQGRAKARRARRNRKQARVEEARTLRLSDKNLTIGEIARIMKVSRVSVISYLKEAGMR